MSTLAIDVNPLAEEIQCTKDELTVSLVDGRRISVPLAWFPRLANASQDECNNWELLGEGQGIRWPDIDEDLSVSGLLKGTRLDG